MIESNIIEWLDFGESTQKIDAYSKKKLIYIFKLFRELLKNKFPVLLDILLIIISFIQFLCLTIYFIPNKNDDFILKILDNLKNIFIVSNLVDNEKIYFKFHIPIAIFIYLDIFLMLFILFTIKKIKLKILLYIVNLINVLIFYYFIGPIIEVSLLVLICEDGKSKYLGVKCFKHFHHLTNLIFSFFIFILYIFVSILYSIFCNEIGSLSTNLGEKLARINCRYELIYLIEKIFIFLFYFIIKVKIKNNIIILIYIGIIFVISISMSIYVYKYVYYYNKIVNYIINIGWFFSSWFSLSIFIYIILNVDNVSSIIIIGWVIIFVLLYKMNQMKEISLITDSNILEFKDIKSIEMHNNCILSLISNKKKSSSKILLFGTIKNFEEDLNTNPEINYHYKKLLNDKYLNKKFDKEIDLPILSIIYILYILYLEKSLFKEEIAIYMSYFLINKFNNPTYAILLSSRIKANGLGLYYKYLLTEDIKEYSTNKLNNLDKKSIKYIQIGSIILYYLYIDLFKLKIYDGITNQIDYFDILRNNITTKKTTSNFIKTGKIILKTRKEILKIWKKIFEINPFSDETFKDYMLYLDTILQDDILVREETKNYLLLKRNKLEEKNNTYHKMFLFDTSSILLIDGYMSVGKILYGSPNFLMNFSYNSKEILNFNVDDILPNVIQTFHKDLVDEAIKYSNINYRFKRQINSLLKNRNGGLFNIKLYVKPVPNISFGLIFFAYLQKVNKSNFVIILDKDLKINGFTEMGNTGSPFTIEIGYNLSHTLYGYHIGVIIPDILPLIEYKNEEFNIIKKDLELKGYLYHINNLSDIKKKVDNIITKIKNNKNYNNEGQFEDYLQNINEEFNELIFELNKLKTKPYSIFYRVEKFSFLNNKSKYYKININDDIITGNEKEQILNKEIEESKKFKTSNYNEIKSNMSKMSKEYSKKIKLHISSKNIKIEKNFVDSNINEKNNLIEKKDLIEKNDLIDINNNEINDIDQNDNYYNATEEKSDNNENKDKDKNKLKRNNKIINSSLDSDSDIYQIDSNFNKIKINIIKKKQGISTIFMEIIGFLFGIINIAFIYYDNYTVEKYFRDMSLFFETNQIFNMTKISIGVIYIMATNIKWEIHDCLKPTRGYSISKKYDDLIEYNIKYLLKVKNLTEFFGEEFKDILEKKFIIGLDIYGHEDKEYYEYNLENILIYFVNSGIFALKSHNILLDKSKETTKDIDPLSFGFNELLDLENQTYLFFISDFNGFSNQEKIRKIKYISTIFPLILNSILLSLILIIYIIFILRLNNLEMTFLEKLINFNSPNFDGYLKNLEEIKKKLQNDSNTDDEEKDDLDINDLVSRNNSKKEDNNKKKELKETKLLSHKKTKKIKSPNKLGKIIKQKNNKMKIMSSFFIKINIFLAIKILLIMILSLSYYIVTVLFELTKKKEFMFFDIINSDIITVYKESFDIFIKFKKELELFENNLEKCDVIEQRNLYHIDVPTIDKITTSNFGNNIMEITAFFNFKGQTLDKFRLLFSEDACKILSEDEEPIIYVLCTNIFKDILFKGMEQSLSKMNSLFGSVIEELDAININGKLFKEYFNDSKYHLFELFIIYFYQKAIFMTDEIFNSFRNEELNKILKIFKTVLIIYFITNIASCIILIYLFLNTHFLINSFFYFIGILPYKFISEDEKLHKEIILFGNHYYSTN